MPKNAIRFLTYGILGGAAVVSFSLPDTVTVPTIHAAGGTGVRLTGIVRDFPVTHPDFNVVPADGAGHYAGNVATLLGDDGRPLQVHGVSNFTIEFGKIVPGIPYAARATVLGAEITSGMDPMPVTIQAATDTETFDPFGDPNDPVAATVNDGANPRDYVFSLTDVYSAETPIAITATSWVEGAGSTRCGFDTVFTNEGSDADSRQVATRITLSYPGTVTSISAYVYGAEDVMYGLYDDSGGEPGTLLTETVNGESPSSWGWWTRPVTPTWLPAGDYWLAIGQDESFQRFRFVAGGGETRTNNHDAEDNNGFQSTWSGTATSSNRRLSIYANITPDAGAYAPHMTVSSGDDSPYVIVLKDGDPVPAVPSFGDQSTIADFVAPYVDLDTDQITLADNQAIYLFELGTTDLSSPSADFQDLVVMLTLATDPVYFFASGSGADGLEPVGFKV
ncbi:MAG: hypothetical protein HKN62_02695, partial [Phycisphaerales bacterium]|nr:hypothetical protein [Phycisphaerales bacterium]